MASDEEVDIIVQYLDRAPRVDVDKKGAVWGERRRTFSNLPFDALRVKRSQLEAIANDPNVAFVSPDRDLGATHFPPWMLREAVGYRFAAMAVPERPVQTGKNVGIAIIDSGVSADDYLKDASTNCTTSRIVYSQNFVSGESTTNDVYGHGTHVAGIAAGAGRCLPGQYVDMSGMAPDAKIINLRVLDGRGVGKDSAVINAIDRAIALKTTYKIKVINLSLGRVIASSYSSDPLCQAVERAWKAGITVVVAAGNNGRDNSMGTKGYATITSPANDPYVITVGATRMVGSTGREDDTVTSYSSKGPTLRDHIVKPDLVAPGNIVYARMSPSSYLVSSYQANTLGLSMAGGPNVPNIFLLSGTSMAAPVVAGSAALLLQQAADAALTLTNDQIKARLMKTAFKNFIPSASIPDNLSGQTFNVQHDLFTRGAGYLDVKSALASSDRSPSGKADWRQLEFPANDN